MGICEDFGAVGDSEGGAPSAGCGVILGFESVTAGYVRGFSWEERLQDGRSTAYGFYYAGEHDKQASVCV